MDPLPHTPETCDVFGRLYLPYGSTGAGSFLCYGLNLSLLSSPCDPKRVQAFCWFSLYRATSIEFVRVEKGLETRAFPGSRLVVGG